MIQVALLRGINVGGKNSVPMRGLAELFADAGCSNVRTYIQSGNVIFESGSTGCTELGERLSSMMLTRFGCKIPIAFRTAEELDLVLKGNPFLQADIPENVLHIYFLGRQPTPEDVAQLDPERSVPDSFVVRGSEIYLRLPNGMARTKLTNAYFDAKLRTVCTARNWRTVQKIRELMA